MSLSKLKALLVISTVFLLGAVVGASLGTSIVSKKFASPTEGAAKSGKEKLIDKFKARLNLSPGQTETLQLILDDTHKQLKDARSDSRAVGRETETGIRGHGPGIRRVQVAR